MKKILPLSLVLAGCASAPPAPTQVVQVPVYTSCVKNVPTHPDYEFGKLSLDASDGEKILALARDWPRAVKYGGDLEAVIAGCR